jgi:hypothetical protein
VIVLRAGLYKEELPKLIHRYGKMRGLDEWLSDYTVVSRMDRRNEVLKALAIEKEVEYIPSLDFICPNGVCRTFYRGAPIFADRMHFTKEGSLYFAEQIREHMPEFVE